MLLPISLCNILMCLLIWLSTCMAADSCHIKEGHCFFFTLMGPCIVNVFKQDQQDATLHNGIYYYKCSSCFRRFLRPSSEAQNRIHSIGYLSSFFCFLPLSSVSWKWVSEFQLTHDSGNKKKKLDKYPMLCIQFRAPDDGLRNRLKHVEHL